MMMSKPLENDGKQAPLEIQKSSKLLTGRKSNFILMDIIKFFPLLLSGVCIWGIFQGSIQLDQNV